LNGLPTDPVREVAEAIVAGGGQAVVYLGDVAEETAARACVDLAMQRFGRLDVLVNNAGIFIANAETDDYRIEDFDRTVRHNLRTAFLMTKFALPYLQKSRGNIICAAPRRDSTARRIHSLWRQQRFFARLCSGRGLRAGQIWRAGQLRLPRTHRHRLDASGHRSLDEAMAKSIDAVVPLGRRGTPEEMANIYAFLASDEASYVTGRCGWPTGSHPRQGQYGRQRAGGASPGPGGVLPLRHSHDGENGKEVYRAKK